MGSLVQLRGVYSILADESRRPRALRLYVPPTEPVQLVEAPSWWNTRRASSVVSIMVVIGLTATFWAMLLRRRVRAQTLVIRERLEKEAALQERYREIFDGAKDLIFTQDLAGRLTSLNPAGQQALGYSAEEVKELMVERILAPGSRDLVRRLLELDAAHGNVMTCDCELVAKDGRRLLVETSLRLMHKDGKPHSVQAIGRDITERRRIDEKLRESEARYRRMVELSPTATYIQCEGRIAFINRAALELFGASQPEQVLGKPVLDLVHPDCREVVAQRMATLRDSAASVPLLDEKYLRLDGGIVDVEVAAAPYVLGDKPAVQVILHDITERKRATLALREASTLLETLLENSPDRIYFKDSQSRFVRYSKAFAKLFNAADPESLRGKTDFDFFTEEHARPAYEDEQQIIRTGKPLIGKLEKETHPDGRITWALTTKMPWRDKHGQIVGTFGISKDVTAIKDAEMRLAYERELFRALVDHLPDTIYFKDRESRFLRLSRSKVVKARQILERRYREEHPSEKELPDYLTDVDKCAQHLLGKTDFDVYAEERARPAFDQEQEIIRTGQPLIGHVEKSLRSEDGKPVWYHTTKMPMYDEQGQIIGTFGVTRDITALKETEEQLAHERELLRALVESLPDNLFFKDRQSRFVRVSKSKVASTLPSARRLYLAKHPEEASKGLPPHLASVEAFGEYIIGKTDFDTSEEDFAHKAFAEEQAIIQTGQSVIGKLEHIVSPDGSSRWKLVSKMPWRDKDGNIIGTFGVSRDITALKEAEAKLEVAHQRLIETSRLAGMAEVATDVLHNVGNVLNSVNVSCSLTIDRVKASKVASLAKVSSLLQENRGRLGEFLTNDPRGQQIPGLSRGVVANT